MIRSLRLQLVLAVAVMLAAAPAADAITDGTLDGDGHPNVGLLGFDRNGVATGLCSGVLVSPTAFLTAGHCTAALAGAEVPAWVSFDSSFDPLTSPRLAVASLHTSFTPDYSIEGADVGVAVLVGAAAAAPAPLAPVGFLDGLRQAATLRSTTVTSVGYGRCGRQVGGGRPTWCPGGDRRRTDAAVLALNATWLRLDGGTCFGDSGGPQLVAGAVVAITTGGADSCAAYGVDYRVDTAAARAFLDQFLTP